MNKNLLNKLFWVFWFSTTVWTGILSGYMLSHSIMLGRFFSWYVESGNMDLLRQTFTAFIKASNPDPNIYYNIPLYLAFVSGLIWTVLAFLLRRDRIIALIAGLSTFWVGNIFFLSDLDEAENAVLTGIADDHMAQFFLAINLPIHTFFAVIYGVSFLLLLLVVLKGHWNEANTN